MQIIDEFRRQELSHLFHARKSAIEQTAEQYPVLPGLRLQAVQFRRGARRPRDRIEIDHMPARAGKPAYDFGQRWGHASFRDFAFESVPRPVASEALSIGWLIDRRSLPLAVLNRRAQVCATRRLNDKYR